MNLDRAGSILVSIVLSSFTLVWSSASAGAQGSDRAGSANSTLMISALDVKGEVRDVHIVDVRRVSKLFRPETRVNPRATSDGGEPGYLTEAKSYAVDLIQVSVKYRSNMGGGTSDSPDNVWHEVERSLFLDSASFATEEVSGLNYRTINERKIVLSKLVSLKVRRREVQEIWHETIYNSSTADGHEDLTPGHESYYKVPATRTVIELVPSARK